MPGIRSRLRFLVPAGCLVGFSPFASALSADYEPVTCPSASRYEGQPLRTYDFSAVLPAPVLAQNPLADPVASNLDLSFTDLRRRSKAVDLAVAVNVPGKGAWAASTAPDKLFYWASAGKLFTAIAFVQLADEGALRLDDLISKWVAGVPNGDAITIEHLLTHTSGLFSANEDRKLRKSPRRLSLEDELAIVRRHGAMFCPGANWRYSNSGYALLGAVLERVEQKPYRQIIEERIIRKLTRSDIRVISADDALQDVAAPHSQTAERPIDITMPGPAGAIVATPSAMIATLNALLRGQLISDSSTRAMLTLFYPMFSSPESYGRGIMVFDLDAAGAPGEGQWIGHSGGAPGVKAILAYSVKDNAFVAVALTGDGPAEAVAASLLRAIK